jgi:hypothetical protein
MKEPSLIDEAIPIAVFIALWALIIWGMLAIGMEK